MAQEFEKLNVLIENLLKATADLKPMYDEMAPVIGASIIKTFQMGGRPEAWKPSKRAQEQGGQTMLNTGRLMKEESTPSVTSAGIVVGSSLPFAKIHHFGFDGNQEVRAFRRRVRSRDIRKTITQVDTRTGEISKSREMIRGMVEVKAFTRHMKMPMRRSMMLQDEDMPTLAQIAAQFVLR